MMHKDELGIYDIYTVISTPFWQKQWFKGGLLFFALLIIGFLGWWLMRILVSSKKGKNVPLRLMVLQKIKQLNDVNNRDNIQKLYADLGFVLRLFFTDLHGRDMLSLTENEMIHHIDDCALCAESFSYVKKNALLHEWRAEIRQLLERTSDVKYKAELNEHTESIKNDISFVTTVVQSVYFKK